MVAPLTERNLFGEKRVAIRRAEIMVMLYVVDPTIYLYEEEGI